MNFIEVPTVHKVDGVWSTHRTTWIDVSAITYFELNFINNKETCLIHFLSGDVVVNMTPKDFLERINPDSETNKKKRRQKVFEALDFKHETSLNKN